ncbi:uncharacterized protein LOC122010363 [Zingiber officinale]|uniref:Uncharacterized protein n=1 Tax=Zingiber officinale TaxID=94328 RepID=A0A8J5I349_ZINOF|nr:uncharacterized protein LOC122010363 [Zingiber officinale]KAG6534305.1 hypothetical protein ZIOFF_008191 [Zingiber officinale]
MAEAHQLHFKLDRCRSPPRRVLSRCPRIGRSPRSLKAATEALGRANDNSGSAAAAAAAAVPVKIMLTKKQLRQLVAALNQEPAAVGSMPAKVELLLDVLQRRQHPKRTEVVQPRCGGWRPVLQSIPEEAVQD